MTTVAEQVIEDAGYREQHADQGDMTPAEEPVEHQAEQVPGERGEAGGHANEQERHDRRPGDAKNRPGQQGVRLAGL
jgi:hypothetical protein